MRTRSLVVALVVAGCLIPGIAAATHRDALDPNDTRGRLDVRRVVTWGKPPRWTIWTGAKWTVRGIWDRGYFFIYFDAFGDRGFDQYALVRSNGRELLGSLWRMRPGSDRRKASVVVSRSSARNAVVRLALSKLDIPEKRRFYRWQVRSEFLSGRCKGGVCLDKTRIVTEELV